MLDLNQHSHKKSRYIFLQKQYNGKTFQKYPEIKKLII